MKKHKVLVVDNSPVIQKLVGSILEKQGCEVRVADNGLDAFDLLPLYHPDIIFTDLVMPKIDGAKLCFLVRNTERLKDIFLVVLSGIAMEDDDKVSRLGADMCIAKGPSATMEANIKIALQRYEQGERGDTKLHGLDGLYPREVTSELLSTKYHNEIILKRMSEGVVELDQNGRIVMANRSTLDIFHMEEENFLTTLFSSHCNNEQGTQIQDWIDSVPSAPFEPIEFTYENPLFIENSQVQLYLVPIREDDTIFITGLLSDVTSRKAAEKRERALEKELERVKRLDAMSAMAGGISHDFNNLFTIINGNLELARMHVHGNKKLATLLDESDKAMGHAMNLIRQFTSFSDTCLPLRKEVHIARLVNSLVTHLFKKTNIQTQFESDPDLWPVKVDSSQIILVFTNILQNSIEAIGEEKGSVTVRLANREIKKEVFPDTLQGKNIPPGPYVCVNISDSGSGLEPEVLEHAFDPYFSTKQKGVQKGMGLGLTIVHSIIKKHDGFVWLENLKDGGAKVTILLPSAHYQNTDTADARRRVLFMDDEAMMQAVIVQMLQLMDADVDIAENGDQALALLEQAHSRGEKYDLIILDLQIDKGMGGRETAQKIHELYDNQRLVVTSGDHSDEVIVNPQKFGFIGSLVKPFSVDTMDRLLELADS